MIFQRGELRTLPAPPLFSRLKQSLTDSLILVTIAYCELCDIAVQNFPMHWVGRVLESEVNESNDFTADVGDQRDAPFIPWMLPPFTISCRYCLDCGSRIAFRIEPRMILGTFEEHAGDRVSIG